jgi:hypothetical protein
MMIGKRAAFVLLSAILGGCGLQATSGAAWTDRHSGTPALTVRATSIGFRSNSPVVGIRMGMAIDHALVPKHGIVHGGYDWRVIPGQLVLEPGFDLGLGGPIRAEYTGIGAYLGASGSARLRLLGVNDDDPAFNVIAPIVEAVLIGRGGGWMPPEEADSRALIGEFGVELGLRMTLGSDLVIPVQGKVPTALGPQNSESRSVR